MAKRGEPFKEYPSWTHSRFFSFIRSGLRRMWSRWPPKYSVLAKSRRAAKAKGRHKWEYQCAICSQWFQAKEISVDHIIPAGSLKDYEDLPQFVANLFVGEDKLQTLCSTCHSKKTKEERENNK